MTSIGIFSERGRTGPGVTALFACLDAASADRKKASQRDEWLNNSH